MQVFGAGSLGTLVGAVLSRGGHDVRLVGRQRDVEAVRSHGVSVEGGLEFRASPDAAVEPGDADASLVAVKSYDTGEAARALGGVEPGVVVSLQNGMGNEETLMDRHDVVLAGSTTYGALLVEPGVVRCTGVGVVDVGAVEGGGSREAEWLADEFSEAGLETRYRRDMPVRLWRKLAVNAGINPVTALTRLGNGEAVEAVGDVVRAAAREAGRVAASRGVDVGDAAGEAVRVARATAGNRSSMLQDVLGGGRTEVDAINGYVVRNAGEVDVPVNAALLHLVRGLEVGVGGVEG